MLYVQNHYQLKTKKIQQDFDFHFFNDEKAFIDLKACFIVIQNTFIVLYTIFFFPVYRSERK